MKTFALTVLAAIAGYALGAILGYGAISALSANTHDKSFEAAMTAAFVTGPLVALLAVIGALAYRSQTRRPGPK